VGGKEMSKLIDKLNQVSSAIPQPMGFRTMPSVSPQPKMLLIASLAPTNVENVADYVAGADAGVLYISDLGKGVRTVQKVGQVVSGIPWGMWLRDIGQGEVKQVAKAGYDFVVFPAANTSLAILQDDEAGKILQVEASLGEGLLRAVNELPVNAVLIAGEQGEGSFLTWHHLMLFQRFANLLTKPLLVCVPSKVSANELQALWEAGVSGVVVEVGVGQPVPRLNELRQAIDKLTFPALRKRERVKALLPYISGETAAVTEEEEE